MRAFLVLLVLSFALSLTAQEKLVETIEVKVVNVDVVVTDRAGKPVTGLTKNDFELFENGKPQEISNFYEITPEQQIVIRTGTTTSEPAMPPAAAKPQAATSTAAAPEDIRARRFVFLLDNYSMEPAQRNKTIAAMRKFIDTNFKRGDEAALYVWTRKAETLTPLTKDKSEVLRALDTLVSRSRSGMSAIEEEGRTRQSCNEIIDEVDGVHMTWEQAWLHCEGNVRAFTDSVWMNETTLLRDIKAIVSTLGGIDGRKVLVMAGAHLPEHPGRETMMWAAQQFEPHVSNKAHIVTRAMSEGTAHSQTFAISDVANFANANGVAFYTIDAADQGSTSSAESPSMADVTDAFMSFTDTASAFKALADITGGAALSGTQNFEVAFQTLARDLSTFYSIGYKSTDGSNESRKITVRTKKSGLTVRARKSYTPKSSDQEMNDRVVANLFHQPAQSEWPITLSAKPAEKNGDLYKVPVTIALQPDLTLIPQEKNLVGGFVLYIVVGTKDGAMSKVTKNARKIEIPSGGEAELRSKPMTFTLMLSVKPGDNIVSVGVTDQISSITGFDRIEVAAK